MALGVETHIVLRVGQVSVDFLVVGQDKVMEVISLGQTAVGQLIIFPFHLEPGPEGLPGFPVPELRFLRAVHICINKSGDY